MIKTCARVCLGFACISMFLQLGKYVLPASGSDESTELGEAELEIQARGVTHIWYWVKGAKGEFLKIILENYKLSRCKNKICESLLRIRWCNPEICEHPQTTIQLRKAWCRIMCLKLGPCDLYFLTSLTVCAFHCQPAWSKLFTQFLKLLG